MLSALEAAPAPDYSTTLSDQSRPMHERLAAYSRAVAAEEPGDTEEVAVYLEFYAALLRSPDALRCYSGSRERRLQELADADEADSDDLATGVTPVQVWAIGQAMLVGLQIYKRLAPGQVTPEVFERIRPAGQPLPGGVKTTQLPGRQLRRHPGRQPHDAKPGGSRSCGPEQPVADRRSSR